MGSRPVERVGRRRGLGRLISRGGAALLLAACGGGPTAPQAELTELAASAHFTYRWSPGDEAPDTAYQERHLAWVTQGLGLTPGASLEYFKYRDVKQLERLTGHDRGTGFAEDGTYRFHTIYERDNHEYVHALVTAEVGTPPALFNEGVAVAHHGASFVGAFDGDPLWNGTSARDRVRALRDAGALPELADLLENADFQRLDGQVTYPVAGVFVRYLLDETGPQPLLTLIATCPRDASASVVRARFLAAYGEEIDIWWARWLAAL